MSDNNDNAEELARALAVLKRSGYDIKSIINATGKTTIVNKSAITGKELPPGWSSTSSAPYYREAEALAAKKLLDKILKENIDRLVLPKSTLRRSLATTHQALTQGIMYLCNKLDPAGIYANIRKQLRISQDKSKGIVIDRHSYIIDQDATFDPDAAVIEAAGEQDVERALELQDISWRNKVDEFLQNAQDGDKITIQVVLTKEEKTDLAESLEMVSGLYYSIGDNKITLRKYSGPVSNDIK